MKRIFTLALAGLMALMMVGCSQIDTGNVGVIKTGGQFKAEELTPGWHFTLFSTVFEVSTKENGIPFENLKPKTADQITVEDLDIDIYQGSGHYDSFGGRSCQELGWRLRSRLQLRVAGGA